MAKIQGSVPVAGFIGPTDDSDVFPVTVEEYQQGGYRTVADLDELYRITPERCKDGMLAFIYNIRKFYQRLDGKWDVANFGVVSAATGITPEELAKLDLYTKDEIDNLLAQLNESINSNKEALSKLNEQVTALDTEVKKKANSDSVYDKTEADDKFALKTDVADLEARVDGIVVPDAYSKAEVDEKLANAVANGQVDLSGYIPRQEAEDKFAGKDEIVDLLETATEEINNGLNEKLTELEGKVDTKIDDKLDEKLADQVTKIVETKVVEKVTEQLTDFDGYSKEEADNKFVSKDELDNKDVYSKEEVDKLLENVQPGEGGMSTYTNANPTTVAVGGIAVGSTFDKKPLSELLDEMFHPYQNPAFTRFSIANNVLEVGATFNTPASFSWSMSNTVNVKQETLSIEFNGGTLTLEDNQKTTTGNNVQLAITPVKKDTVGSVVASIKCINTKDGEFRATASVTWKLPYFRGVANSETITAETAKTFTKTLADNIKTTHNFDGSGYEYIVYPANWGLPTQVKDNSGFGFAYVMLGNLTFSNDNGISTEYRVLRSKEYLNTNVPMIIS